jgi:uncharacterized protein (DUF1697 family)
MRYVAFLRAINAGPGLNVRMSTLRQAFEALGFTEVTSVAATGNLIFETQASQAPALLERQIEAQLRQALGYGVPTFIRTLAELAAIAAYAPFPPAAGDEHNIIFLSGPAEAALAQRVAALATDANAFHVHGREIYWLRRKKPDGTYFATAPIQKAIDLPFTVRGEKIIKKIANEF